MASTAPRWREAAARAASRIIPADVLWYVDTGVPAVGLTFDDGPSPHTTPELLDVLATLAAANDGGPRDARIGAGLLAGVRPGSIVVLHEGTPGRRGVAWTTDELLAGLAGRGLSAVAVSALAALGR